MDRRACTFVFLFAVPLFQLLCPATVEAGRLTGTVQAGFDSFTEKYSVVEQDTLDQLNEFRTRIGIGYLDGSYLRDYFLVEGVSTIGEQNLETSGRLRALHRFQKYRLAFDTALTLRTFRENSVYAFPNDFLRYNLRAWVQRQLTPSLSIRLTDRLETMNFDQRTEFDYDYVRNTIALSTDLEQGYTTSYHVTAAFTNRSVPDSSAISYQSFTGAFEVRTFFGLDRHLFFTLGGERREYEDPETRSPFTAISSSANIRPVTVQQFRLSFEDRLESYIYDEDNGAYFDFFENRASLLVSYYRSFNFSVGVGPTHGIFISGSSGEDEYEEFGAKLSVDFNTGKRMWLSASYEPGSRDYRVDSAEDTEIIFSDFIYHRVLLFSSVRVLRNTDLNLFLNVEPQNHKIKGDDSITTLFSVDLSYRF